MRRLPARTLVAALAVAPLALACSGDGGGDLAAFCQATGDDEQFETVFDDLDPTDVPGALATFEDARDRQRELRAVAPAAARNDIDVVIAFVDDLIAGLGPGHDIDGQGRPSVYQSLRPRFDEVEAAGQRLRVYVDANC